MPKLIAASLVNLILVLVSKFENLHAQEKPIQTDRPDQTETPSLVPKNYFQLEAGFQYEKTNNTDNSFLYPTVLYKYGLTDNFELRLITEFGSQKLSSNTIAGLSPVLVGIKAKLSSEKGCLPATSFIGHLAIPTLAGDKLKATYYAPAFRFTMQHTLSDRVSLSYNIGAEWDGETPEPIFIYTLSANYSISEKIGSFIEVYGFAPQENKADHRFDAGLSYLVSPNAQFDISAGFGITSNAPKYFLSVGYSFRIKTH